MEGQVIAERIAEWRRGLPYNAATNSYRVTCEGMERLTELCLSLDGEVLALPRDSEGNVLRIGDLVQTRASRGFPYGRAAVVARFHYWPDRVYVGVQTDKTEGTAHSVRYEPGELHRVDERDSWARIVADSFAAGAAAAEGSMPPNEARRLVERCVRLVAEEMGASNG